ncbi:hypothetical protein BHF71_02335 [Vulcanibacillus modesticaldus]|uniref:Phospholipase C/D domain-containing protein n=1 Tax=Vulcanibacillus modesticaldus TaxID=337097 RepID=A0A1D2YTL9_9BACI|nr:zinc dependent phospholipase C family protein [Vulcanibacillus modesticaldus]OEF99044.1 hypothetical protein BHF71_02335 [Vulcanibacillus modesticaldus]
MPNVWTHNIFAERVAEKAKIDISQARRIYNLGAQGPDLFFYHNFWPWKKKKSLEYLGSKIHKENCGEFLIQMISYIKRHSDLPILKYYVLGFISHHLLDRNTHPYIIYKSGEGGHKHQELEIIIDSILAKDFYDIETWKTPVYKEIYASKNLDSSIQSMIAFLINKVHHIDLPNFERKINRSYKDMITALKILFDPSGLKQKIFGELVSPYTYKRDIPNKDFLNQNKELWLHPANENATSRESFYELLEKAEEEGRIIFLAIEDYLRGFKSLEFIQGLIGNISYDTGESCEEKLKYQYFDIIV